MQLQTHPDFRMSLSGETLGGNSFRAGVNLTDALFLPPPQEASNLTLFLKENLFLEHGFSIEPRVTLNLRSLGLCFLSAGISRVYFYFLFTWVTFSSNSQ